MKAWWLVFGAVCCGCVAGAVATESLIQTRSLDGEWEILFDHQNVGREADWHCNAEFAQQPGRQEINVPSCWELIEQDYEGVAYYRRTFDVPADWEGRIVRLKSGAVNYIAEVWLNDEVVGHHEGGFIPFEFRIDRLLRVGASNTLILRAVDPIVLSDKSIDGIGPLETPQWRGGLVGGIWQSVQLVVTGEVYIDDFDWFSPDFKMQYHGPGSSWWGSGLVEAPYGQGRCIVSQLRILPHLGIDPVADKLLFNLIRYVTNSEDS
jgi:beta-galactosidase